MKKKDWRKCKAEMEVIRELKTWRRLLLIKFEKLSTFEIS